jgi:hypothetical protein
VGGGVWLNNHLKTGGLPLSTTAKVVGLDREGLEPRPQPKSIAKQILNNVSYTPTAR